MLDGGKPRTICTTLKSNRAAIIRRTQSRERSASESGGSVVASVGAEKIANTGEKRPSRNRAIRLPIIQSHSPRRNPRRLQQAKPIIRSTKPTDKNEME